MLIKKLILKDYKRLMLNNIKEFIYEPVSSFQLILGTNGSGKSSVLRELSPLPAFSGDYTKEGSKTIELEENNNNYTLISTFKNGNKHTFIRNGETLNDEGTASVQKELIEKYFDYTQEIHDLLIGDVCLTDMAPQKRREWFTKLSPNDLSYAVNAFNFIKARFRDTQGAQAHVNKRLTAETNALLSLTDIDNIDNRVEMLKQDIILFLENKDPKFNLPDIMEREIYRLIDKIDEQSHKIISRTFSPRFGLFGNYSELEEYCKVLDEQYKLSLNTLNMKTSEYADLENLMLSVKRAGVDGIEGLNKRKNEINQQKHLLNAKLKQFNYIGNVESVLLNNKDVLSLTENILQILPSNDEGYFSREKIAQHEENLNKLKEKILSIRLTKGRAEERYEYVHSAQDVECPRCQFVWKPGISEHELASLKVKMEECEKLLLTSEEEYKQASDYLIQAEEYISLWRKFKNIVDDNPSFKVLWDFLLEDNLVIKSPKKAVAVLYTWKNDCDVIYQLRELELQERNIQIAFDAASEIESISGINAFQERIESVTKEIEKLTLECQQKKDCLDINLELYNDAAYILKEFTVLEQYVDKLDYTFNEYQKGLKNVMLNDGIAEMNSTLGQIQNKLNEKQTLESLINDLTKDAANLEMDFSGYKFLMDELSPVNGLIADQLYGNIQCIVSQMNEIISQIWTYDLEILPCGLESGELDYKFPLQVRSANNEVPDISKGSTAQVEVVNFAFKLVVMLYLNMTYHPLFLDEIGHSFDEQHRSNIMNYIKLLIESKRHSQLFMISHYAPQYGAMTQAEICVLDSSNISMPFVHNKHVTMR